MPKIHYTTVVAEATETLDGMITTLLSDGWELYGSPYCAVAQIALDSDSDAHIEYYQAMIFRGDPNA